MIGKVIYSKLSSLVGNKVYPLVAAQGTAYPYITYQVISDIPTYTKEANCDYENSRVQVNVFSKTYSQIETLTTSIKSALDRLSETVAGVVVDYSSILNEIDMFEENDNVYHRAIDFEIKINT